jgi:hypothetical protein
VPDLVTGVRIANLGGNAALQFCLESTGDTSTAAPASTDDGPDAWAERFHSACGGLAEAELVLAHCKSGFMRLAGDGGETFDAWIATKRVPASWREREDYDWWSSWLARRHEPELRALEAGRPGADRNDSASGEFYRRMAIVHLQMMPYQLDYPPDTEIGGCTVQTWYDVLAQLIELALRAQDLGEGPLPQSERSLVATIASALAADPATVVQALAGFTLDREGAAWHAAVPGVAAAPLIRTGPDRIVLSLHGLTTDPLLFLTRELRRRDAQEYHNHAFLRERAFRQDLYGIYENKRFVTSSGRIELRKNDGNIRTDIDAAIFDRKTGTLGVFELKSQDPFARSAAELTRQRDSVLFANRQVSGVLAWLNRSGAADDLLGRVDRQTAKRFRVRKVYPFVLGRYLAHFGDGMEPDSRASWGTWPQLLRLVDETPIRPNGANPIASLFTRLAKESPLVRIPAGDARREITIGGARLVVHPSYAAYQGGVGGEGA